MMDTTSDKQAKYKAFISYSHRDSKFAQSLHKKLESYKLPNGGSLYPVFLDESELKLGSELGTLIEEAIAQSEYLIVICSENSTQSKWVRAEIDLMRAIKGDERIIGVIPDKAGNETHLQDLFGETSDHLAADFRAGKNKFLQISKIAATLSGRELDELYQRESRRKSRQVAAMALGSVVVASLMSALAANAYVSEQEAVRQRQKSEEVFTYMIDEFRGELEALDKLDLLASVGTKAQDYFESRPLDELSDNSVLLQSRALRQLSDVDEKRGDLVSAKQRIVSAYQASKHMIDHLAVTEMSVKEHGENAQQWGYIEYQLGDLKQAETHSREAMDTYALGLSKFPDNSDLAWSRAISEQNVGVMILQSGHANVALPFFKRALSELEVISDSRELGEDELYELSNIYSWYIRSLPDSTPLSIYYETHDKQLALFDRIRESGGRGILNQAEKLNIERAIVKLHLDSGRDDEARNLMVSIQKEFTELLGHDPENIGWRRHLMRSKLTLARLEHKQGRLNDRNRLLEQVLALWDKPDGEKWLVTTDIVLGIDRLQARRLAEDQSIHVAVKDLERAEQAILDFRKDKIRPRDRYNMASLNSVKAELLKAHGQVDDGQTAQRKVLEYLSTKDNYSTTEQKLQLQAYLDLAMTDKANAIKDKFAARGIVLD